MHTSLAELLAQHAATDDKEVGDLALMREMLASLREPFSRHQPQAHFTGSAIVADGSSGRVCLLLHRKLQRWLQPGGHAEPRDEGSLLRTALREAREETGLNVSLHPAAPAPLDVDVHRIPERKDEPAHWHLDLRFLLLAENPEALAMDPAESVRLQWFSLDEACARADDPSLRRLLRKAERWVEAPGG